MPVSRSDWTILVYIAAHNNLDTWGLQSLNQLVNAGSDEHVKLAVLFDGWQGATRYLLGPAGAKPTVTETLGGFDSGDPQRLLETTQWAFEKNPAQRYGLVLWSHGTGYWNQSEFMKITKQVRGASAEVTQRDRAASAGSLALFRTTLQAIMRVASDSERAILFDNGTQHSLDTLQLEAVLRDLRQFAGQPLDLLGMDACLMGNLEVAYQVRQHARCLVASEELVPGTSWPYDDIMAQLHAQPEMSAPDLSKLIVQAYGNFYAAHPPTAGDVTKIALDLAQIEDVTTPLKVLAATLRAAMPAEAAMLWQVQYATFKKETNNQRRERSKFTYHLWDLADLAAGIAAASPDANVRAAAEAVVHAVCGGAARLAETHQGAWFDDTGGLSIYMAPTDPAIGVSQVYSQLALAKDTGWDQLLTLYKQSV